MRPQPLICVRDVEASSRWYQRLHNCQSDHGDGKLLVARGGFTQDNGHTLRLVLAVPDKERGLKEMAGATR